MSAAAPVVDNLDTKILTALTDTENGWGGLVKL